MSEMAAPVLQVAAFGPGRLSLSVAAGSLTALLGPNRSGKTRLLDAIGRHVPPEGRILVDGQDVAARPPAAVAALGVARVWRYPTALAGFSVLEQVLAGGYLRRPRGLAAVPLLPPARRAAAARQALAARLLERVGLADKAAQPAASLRAGELRRLDIARALAAAPRLLLLDEPASGLLEEDRERVGTLLQALRDEGMALLAAEHSVAFAGQYCDRAVVVEGGRMLAEGTPAECLEHDEVQEALFGRQSHADRLRALD